MTWYVNPWHYPITLWSTSQRTVHNLQLPSLTFSLKTLPWDPLGSSGLLRMTWVWSPGVGDGQGGLVCCDSWGRKESNTAERLNWTEMNIPFFLPGPAINLYLLPNLWSFSLTVHQAQELGFDHSCAAWATAAPSIARCRDFWCTYPQNHLQISSKRGQVNLSTVQGCKFKPILKESQFFRIQVNPKGNQPWIFFGRTDAEVDTPILWPPDAKSWLIGKDPDAGKDWGQEEKGTTKDEMIR